MSSLFHSADNLSRLAVCALVGGSMFVGGALLAPNATATEYRLESSMYTRIMRDDNLTMRRMNEIETFELRMSPELVFSVSDDNWRYQLDTRLDFLRLEDEQFNFENQDFKFTALYVTPTLTWSFDARNDRSSTRENEEAELGILDVETERRDAQTFRPSVRWSLDSRNSITFGVTYDNVHYGSLDYVDYDNYAADVGWQHALKETTVVSVTGYGSRYEKSQERVPACNLNNSPFIGDSSRESDTYGVQAAIQNQFTEKLNVSASVGYQRVETKEAGIGCFTTLDFSMFPNIVPVAVEQSFINEFDNDGVVMDGSVDYTDEKFKITGSISRSITPSGQGFLILRDNLRANVNYKLNAKLSLNFNTWLFDTDALDDDVLFARRGYNLAPSVSWRWTQDWTLSSGVRYRSFKNNNNDEDSEGIQVFVSAKYKFKPWSVSR